MGGFPDGFTLAPPLRLPDVVEDEESTPDPRAGYAVVVPGVRCVPGVAAGLGAAGLGAAGVVTSRGGFLDGFTLGPMPLPPAVVVDEGSIPGPHP